MSLKKVLSLLFSRWKLSLVLKVAISKRAVTFTTLLCNSIFLPVIEHLLESFNTGSSMQTVVAEWFRRELEGCGFKSHCSLILEWWVLNYSLHPTFTQSVSNWVLALLGVSAPCDLTQTSQTITQVKSKRPYIDNIISDILFTFSPVYTNGSKWTKILYLVLLVAVCTAILLGVARGCVYGYFTWCCSWLCVRLFRITQWCTRARQVAHTRSGSRRKWIPSPRVNWNTIFWTWDI